MTALGDERRALRALLRKKASAERVAAASRERRLILQHLRRVLDDCSEFVHDWGDGGRREFPEIPNAFPARLSESDAKLVEEFYGAGDPAWEDWGQLNQRVCDAWIVRWYLAATLLKQAGCAELVAHEQPVDLIDRITHRVFARLVALRPKRKADVLRVAATLAKERARLARSAVPKTRYSLGKYFTTWLEPRVALAIDRLTPSPSDEVDATLVKPLHSNAAAGDRNSNESPAQDLTTTPALAVAAPAIENPATGNGDQEAGVRQSSTATEPPTAPPRKGPDALASDPTRRKVTHAADFSWLNIDGRRYEFRRPQQARVIAKLFEAWETSGRIDGAMLRIATLAEAADSNSDRFRIGKLFDRHPALNEILRSPNKGCWALFLNADQETPEKDRLVGTMAGRRVAQAVDHDRQHKKTRDPSRAGAAPANTPRVASR